MEKGITVALEPSQDNKKLEVRLVNSAGRHIVLFSSRNSGKVMEELAKAKAFLEGK